MKIKELQYLHALRGHLDRHSQFLAESSALYAQYTEKIEMLRFQTDVVELALATRAGIVAAEMATGIGKTIIAARIALACRELGPVLYVCASPTAMLPDGIPAKFMRVASTLKLSPMLGERNDLSRANDVSFISPGSLVNKLRTDREHTESFLRQVSCFIVDEAHHFPQDQEQNLKVYGRIYDIARSLVPGLTFAMTGTWDRLDRKVIMGKPNPDIRLSVQDAVDLGRCPEIYGVQVILDVYAEGARRAGDIFALRMKDQAELDKYHRALADCIVEVYKRYPVPLAAFARTQSEARAVASAVNRQLGIEKFDDEEMSRINVDRGLQLLTARTPHKRRQEVLQWIRDRKSIGYITCAVGEEALDLPPLEVVHLIRRTRSAVRNAQAIGRALRVSPGKQRVLVVDYPVMIHGENMGRFVGQTLDDFAQGMGTRISRILNGGPLFAQPNYPEIKFQGADLDLEAERALVIRQNLTEKQRRLAEFREAMDLAHRKRKFARLKSLDAMETLYDGFTELFGDGPHFDFVEVVVPGDARVPQQRLPLWVDRKQTLDPRTIANQIRDQYDGRIDSWMQGWEHQLSASERHTRDLLWYCTMRADPSLWEEEGEKVPWDPPALEKRICQLGFPAVVIEAILRTFADASFLLECPRIGEADWTGDFQQEVKRQVIREIGGEGAEAIRDARTACREVMSALNLSGWRRNQSNVLPWYERTSSALYTFRVTTLRHVGCFAAYIWSFIQSKNRLVAVRFSNSEQTLRLVPTTPRTTIGNVFAPADDPDRDEEWEAIKKLVEEARQIGPEAKACLDAAFNQAYTSRGGSAPKKAELLLRALRGDYPSHRDEKSLHQMFLHYINPKSKVFDKLFVKAISAIDRRWLGHSRMYTAEGNLKE